MKFHAHYLLAMALVVLSKSLAAPLVVATDEANNDYVLAGTGHTSGGKSHVVLLSADAPHVDEVLTRLALHPEHEDVEHVFNNSAFRGFIAKMNTHCLDAIDNMTDANYEQNFKVSSHLYSTSNSNSKSPFKRAKDLSGNPAAIPAAPTPLTGIRQGTTWGLQYLSSPQPITGNHKSMAYTYTYNNASLAAGVDVYIVDTGINTANTAFSGHARLAFSALSDTADTFGHGTHVAGTAGSGLFGVASGANLIGVKVLGADGTGAVTDVYKGLDWVVSTHDARKNDTGFMGSVMSMSFGVGDPSSQLSDIIASATRAGIHVVVSAGNDGDDACHHGPGNTGGSGTATIVVGSVGPSGQKSGFSNDGPCVDVYAPGEDVLSTWIDGSNSVNYLSGTSMAAPHVSGVVACLLAARQDLQLDAVGLKKALVAMGRSFAGASSGVLLNNGASDLPLAPGKLFKEKRRWVGEGAWDVADETVGRASI